MVIVAALILSQQGLDTLSKPNQESNMDRMQEEKMAAWKPANSYLIPPGMRIMKTEPIIGKWVNGGSMESTVLTFSKSRSDSLQVSFSTGGCLGQWKASRTAKLTKGVFQLNRAVESYSGQIFEHLYLVNRAGGLWLVPGGAVERARELAGPTAEFEDWISFLSFRRVDKPGPQS